MQTLTIAKLLMSSSGRWIDVVKVADVENIYSHRVPASALLFYSTLDGNTGKAVRMEVPRNW